MEEHAESTAVADTYRMRRQSWLRDTASFVHMFSDPGFQFAFWHLSLTHGQGMIAKCVLSKEAEKFALYGAYTSNWLPAFDWLEWLDSGEALDFYEDSNRITTATAEQLAKLLIAYIRNDRFNAGVLYVAFESGILTAIVQRAQALIEN